MDVKCEIIERQSQSALSIRTTTSVGKLPDFLSKAYGEIMHYLATKGMKPAGPPYAAYFNTDMKNLDVEAGFPIAGKIESNGEIVCTALPSGSVATCLFVGPYAEFEDAYEALNELIEEKGLTAVGTAYEFYLNDPKETEPEDLQTEIVLPIKG